VDHVDPESMDQIPRGAAQFDLSQSTQQERNCVMSEPRFQMCSQSPQKPVCGRFLNEMNPIRIMRENGFKLRSHSLMSQQPRGNSAITEKPEVAQRERGLATKRVGRIVSNYKNSGIPNHLIASAIAQVAALHQSHEPS
jgi:hypothetical protein